MTTDPELTALIATLEEQEQRLQFSRFTNEDAWVLGGRIRAVALDRGLPIAIDIRRHGQQLFHTALDGSTSDNDSWIERKARVVDRFLASSYLTSRKFAARGGMLDETGGVRPIDYVLAGGSFPIRVRDVGVVGTITVSGLAGQDDHALIVEIVTQFLGESTAS